MKQVTSILLLILFFQFTVVSKTIPGSLPAQMTVYPNPVADFFVINGLKNQSKIELQNSAGQTVLSQQYLGKVDLRNASQGIYLLKEKGIGAIKLIKN